MSLADKFNQKTDELKAKAKAALREALDEKDERTHADGDRVSRSAERGRDDESVSRGVEGDRVSRSADRVRDDGSVSRGADDDRVSRPVERERGDQPVSADGEGRAARSAQHGGADVAERGSDGVTARTGHPGNADHDARPRRDSDDLPATERHPDRVSAQPATGSAAGSTTGSVGAAGRSELAGHDARPDSTPGHGTRDRVAHGDPAPSADVTGDERLFSARRARDYAERWDTLQLDFVDDPRRAIADADQLVGDILAELETLFAEQRRHLDRDLGSDRSSTEDLRVALGRYRDFFNRLLSL